MGRPKQRWGPGRHARGSHQRKLMVKGPQPGVQHRWPHVEPAVVHVPPVSSTEPHREVPFGLKGRNGPPAGASKDRGALGAALRVALLGPTIQLDAVAPGEDDPHGVLGAPGLPGVEGRLDVVNGFPHSRPLKVAEAIDEVQVDNSPGAMPARAEELLRSAMHMHQALAGAGHSNAKLPLGQEARAHAVGMPRAVQFSHDAAERFADPHRPRRWPFLLLDEDHLAAQDPPCRIVEVALAGCDDKDGQGPQEASSGSVPPGANELLDVLRPPSAGARRTAWGKAGPPDLIADGVDAAGGRSSLSSVGLGRLGPSLSAGTLRMLAARQEHSSPFALLVKLEGRNRGAQACGRLRVGPFARKPPSTVQAGPVQAGPFGLRPSARDLRLNPQDQAPPDLAADVLLRRHWCEEQHWREALQDGSAGLATDRPLQVVSRDEGQGRPHLERDVQERVGRQREDPLHEVRRQGGRSRRSSTKQLRAR